MIKLTKVQIIAYLAKSGIDASCKSRMSIVDCLGNSIAPERYCYKISFWCPIFQVRKKFAVYPHTVGYQSY